MASNLLAMARDQAQVLNLHRLQEPLGHVFLAGI